MKLFRRLVPMLGLALLLGSSGGCYCWQQTNRAMFHLFFGCPPCGGQGAQGVGCGGGGANSCGWQGAQNDCFSSPVISPEYEGVILAPESQGIEFHPGPTSSLAPGASTVSEAMFHELAASGREHVHAPQPATFHAAEKPTPPPRVARAVEPTPAKPTPAVDSPNPKVESPKPPQDLPRVVQDPPKADPLPTPVPMPLPMPMPTMRPLPTPEPAPKMPAGFTLAVTSAKPIAKVGDELVFRIVLENQGGAPIDGVSLQATLSKNLTPTAVFPRTAGQVQNGAIVLTPIRNLKPMRYEFEITALAQQADGGQARLAITAETEHLAAGPIVSETVTRLVDSK